MQKKMYAIIKCEHASESNMKWMNLYLNQIWNSYDVELLDFKCFQIWWNKCLSEMWEMGKNTNLFVFEILWCHTKLRLQILHWNLNYPYVIRIMYLALQHGTQARHKIHDEHVLTIPNLTTTNRTTTSKPLQLREYGSIGLGFEPCLILDYYYFFNFEVKTINQNL